MAILCVNNNVQMPEFSVTSNLPSTMNGGKDFCEWSKRDRELATTLKKPIEIMFGKYGAGLVNTALGESLFEKGNADGYEIMTMLNSGYQIAEAKGKIELCFAAVGILCRLHVSRNQLDMAIGQLDNFEMKVEQEGAWQLSNNIRTMHTWFRLLIGDKTYVQSWVAAEAPNENQYFYILERYRYMMKVRSYIALGRLDEAMHLIQQLEVYIELYFRFYMGIEVRILKAIVKYRRGDADGWQEPLVEALKIAQEYHFIRVIAQEGAAVKELIDQMGHIDGISPEFMEEVTREVDKMAKYYPKYLEQEFQIEEELTEIEYKVLAQLCQGRSLQDISEQYTVSYSTTKGYCRNIYRKLKVKNRQEAQAKAAKMKLV